MSSVKWIKITTDIFDDEKILLIENLPEADTIIVVWFKLLVLAGKQNSSGVLMMNDKIHYTDEMLATLFRRSLNVIRMALNTFEQFGMIEIINNVVTIPNWEKHQNVDGLEKVREQGRLRTAKHREKQKLLANSGHCNVTGNVTVTQGNALEQEQDKEIDKDNSNNSNSDSIKSVFELFEGEYGRLLSPTQIDNVQKLIQESSPELVKEALRISVLKGKTTKVTLNLSFIEGILRNWRLDNIKSVQDIPKSKPRAFQNNNFQQQKSNVPKWSNPDYKAKSLDEHLADIEGVVDNDPNAF